MRRLGHQWLVASGANGWLGRESLVRRVLQSVLDVNLVWRGPAHRSPTASLLRLFPPWPPAPTHATAPAASAQGATRGAPSPPPPTHTRTHLAAHSHAQHEAEGDVETRQHALRDLCVGVCVSAVEYCCWWASHVGCPFVLSWRAVRETSAREAAGQPRVTQPCPPSAARLGVSLASCRQRHTQLPTVLGPRHTK